MISVKSASRNYKKKYGEKPDERFWDQESGKPVTKKWSKAFKKSVEEYGGIPRYSPSEFQRKTGESAYSAPASKNRRK